MKVRALPSVRTVPCAECPLRNCGAFRELDAKELAFVERFKTGEFKVEAGTTLFLDGSSSAHLYTVLSGWAFRYKLIVDGRRQILNYALPGDFLGLQAALFKELQHSVDALTDTVLCVFERQRFFELYAAHTELAFDVTWLAAREEQMIGDHLVSVGRRSVLERIAYLFLHLHDRLEMLGLAENGSFQLPITQQQLADTLGMSLVHTNKTLKRLLARELVTWRNGTCTIVDRQTLADIAHYDGDLPRRRRPLI